LTGSQAHDRLLCLDDIGAPIAVLDGITLLSASPAALGLIARFQLAGNLPSPLPLALARELEAAPFGSSIVWRPGAELGAVLGCTRYALGADRSLLLMQEITEKQRALSLRLHQHRLEEIGRFAALMAHELRSPLSSIVYNVDLLRTGAVDPASASAGELLQETQIAAEQMRRTIAALLDFVRLGPPVTGAQSLREIWGRVSSLLRPVFRAGAHVLDIDLHDERVRVRGNPLTVEQIFVNLLVNATEAIDRPVRVRVTSERVSAALPGNQPWRAVDDMVRVRVSDDGPGIPSDLLASVFEPFVTSKPHGTGLGLTIARETAQALGGHLEIEPALAGCTVAVVLPIARVAEVAE